MQGDQTNGVKLKLVREESRISSLPEDFVWWWQCYPRKEKKGDAWKAWQQTESIRPQIEELIAAVDKYAEKCKFKDVQYVMLPATYLRSWSWTDDT